MPETIPTSIGPPLRRAGAAWSIDTTELPVLRGLSVLARALGQIFVDSCRSASVDVAFERSLKDSENPELVALGIEGVKVLAERGVLDPEPAAVEAFQDQLRAVFGTLQIDRWRGTLLPRDERRPSRALLFRFPSRDGRLHLRFLLERVPSVRDERRSYLRLTVEDARGRRLDLRSIPHVRVEALDRRRFIAGSTRIAQTLRDLVQRAAERGRRSHFETWRPDSFVFQRLGRAGLGELRGWSVLWSDRFAVELVEMEPARLDGTLKKVLLVLEDLAVRSLLSRGEAVRVRDGDLRVYLDLSQRGRVLNLSLDRPRHRPRVEGYLERMPRLAALARRARGSRPLAGTSVLLIHHVTSEVVAVIGALRTLGCEDLTVLFVRYAGEIPNDYLEALLDLDPDRFSSFALHNVKDPQEAEGHFVLSRQFSPLGDLETLDERFRVERPRYLDAMRRLAEALFARVLARSGPRPCLLVEDGGYLAPSLARRVRLRETFGEFLRAGGVCGAGGREGKRSLGAVLRERLLGTVEHTRNGHDALVAAEREFGSLARPAFSIAVSRIKVEEEAEEVAASVLNAVETVLHATGRGLTERRVLVLGSRGAIGSRLVRRLRGVRPPGAPNSILGLDLVAPARARTAKGTLGGAIEARSWNELPRAIRRGIDLVIGVTGVSVLGRAAMEELLLEGTAGTIAFASGSTKTVEFWDAAAWAEGLLAARRPRLRGRRAATSAEEVLDPQTGRLFGTAYSVQVGEGPDARRKRFVFLANLTPVNFLFYGVPAEGMDRVLTQLVSTALALVRAVHSGSPLESRLYAVDRDIDETGRPLRALDAPR